MFVVVLPEPVTNRQKWSEQQQQQNKLPRKNSGCHECNDLISSSSYPKQARSPSSLYPRLLLNPSFLPPPLPSSALNQPEEELRHHQQDELLRLQLARLQLP